MFSASAVFLLYFCADVTGDLFETFRHVVTRVALIAKRAAFGQMGASGERVK